MVKKLNIKESNNEPRYKFIAKYYNANTEREYTDNIIVSGPLEIKHIWEAALNYALKHSEMTGDELTELAIFTKMD